MESGLRDLIERAEHDGRIPEAIGERCVHALIETASCTACVSVCPTDAWILDDDSLGIDQDACDGCGLCIPACPQGAIAQAQPLALSIRNRKGRLIALAACERADVRAKEQVLPCIHAITLQELLLLLQKGIRHLAITSGICGECARGRVISLQSRAESLNGALKLSGKPGINVLEITQDAWNSLSGEEEASQDHQQLSRRGFLGKLASSSVQECAKLITFARDEQAPFQPPGQLFPDTSAKTQWPFLPTIDPARCNGCDACARLCPHAAIVLEQEEGAVGYRLYPASCSGCNICVDVCEQGAVAIHRWEVQQQQELPLDNHVCRACGVSFHTPLADGAGNNVLCRICAHQNHHKKLFQILE